ncbi:unnamed protein product [Urochloa humidicola]
MESASMSRPEGEDLISKLPSDVLLSILEKLQLPDAVRTGALSRRWRSLPHHLPRLVVHFNDFFPDGDEELIYYEDEGCDDATELPADSPPDTLAQASEAMLEGMVALLASRRAPCDLAVSLLLRRNYMSIGRVLDDAMATGKARAVELDISITYDLDDSDDRLHAGNVMLAYCRRFRTLFDGCPATFGGLTRLTFKNMLLRGRDIHDILTVCTRLETMSLQDCDAGTPRVPWRVQHARLAELTIDHCRFFGGIDLAWLPRLQRFTYRGWWHCPTHPVMSFGNVPRLATVTLSNVQAVGQPTLRLSQIFANTADQSAVADLRLNFKGQNIWVKPECPKRFANMFCNLKYVKIRNLHEDCGLSWISFLLQVSPFLKELHIKLVCDCECRMQHDENEDGFATNKKTNVPWELAAGFKHYGLTRVTIMGLHSTGSESRVVAYIRRLVEAAVNLEEIRCVGTTDMLCDECGAVGTGFPRTDQERDSLRQRISGGEPVPFKIICI